MPADFEQGSDVADVYAAALFALAQAAGTVDEVRGELAELARLVQQDPGFAAFLTARVVDDDARQRSLDRMFRGRLSDLVLNTLQVMNRHGRAGLLPQLLRAYVLRLEAAGGQVEVTATSALPLSAAERREVEQLAAELSGKQPLMEYVVDPEVIGGLVLQIGDRRFDGSLRARLRAARTRLLERSSRGLALSVTK